ncbi:VWA domain-containing protein [Vibrio hannami]|uniref:VWA domain-containing protein n=1 Tax=Vibrio hannami TaxID=2717094 RepID=UPI0030CA2C26
MADFVFLYPLWLLALVPLAGVLYWYSKRQASSGLIASHIAVKLGLKQRKQTKSVTYILASCWLLMTIALAGPSFEKAPLPSYSSDSARMLVLDMSRSMYANDIKPNRLTHVRYKAMDLLPFWKEGSTGLIAYAGDAYTISPLTSDSATLKNLIANLSPEIMPYPGAQADAAVKLAIDTFKQSGFSKGEIILITDDIDDQEKDVLLNLINSGDWKVSILGVGTRDGAPIRLADGIMLTNNAGSPVVAKPDFDNMKEVAKASDGLFATIQNNNSDVEAIGKYTSKINLDAEKKATKVLKSG